MFGGAYGDASLQNWPHRHHNPLPRIASLGMRRNKGKHWGRQPFCPHFSPATGVCGWCDYTLPLFRILGLAGILAASGCLRVRTAWIVFFLFRCWVANGKHGGGVARSSIGCWVAAATGRHCHAISILRHIVKATKATTWLNAGHSNRVCHASSSRPFLSQLEQWGVRQLHVECGIHKCWTPQLL